MKRESRTLFLYCKSKVVVGFLLRGDSFDRVYIGCEDGDFIDRVYNDSAFKQTRKVYVIRGSDPSSIFSILRPGEIDNRELLIVAEEIINSLKRLGGEQVCSSAPDAEAS